MRFKAQIKNILRFSKLAASLGSLGRVAWVSLDNDHVRFTVIPEQGSQDSIFEDYIIQSAADHNAINLEVPIGLLHSALRSALSASSASLRLTKKGTVPILCLTIATHTYNARANLATSSLGVQQSGAEADVDPFADSPAPDLDFGVEGLGGGGGGGGTRSTVITHDVAVRVLPLATVAGIHEPKCREPEVHIQLPALNQIRTISDRLTRLSSGAGGSGMGFTSNAINGAGGANGSSGAGSRGNGSAGSASTAKLELAANMHGELKIGIRTDALQIESCWTGLENPALDPEQVDDVESHPTTRMRGITGEEGWSRVRIDGRDWGRVLSIGRMGGLGARYIACFVDGLALILYVFLPSDDNGAEDVLTMFSMDVTR